MADTEKITINMSVVDLGKIDLLVEEGFYQNRTDFIRNAIRLQLEKHEPSIQRSITRNSFAMGLAIYDRSDLERTLQKGEMRQFHIIGMLVLNDDIPPALAVQTIESVRVKGVFKASDAVKEALKGRIS